MPVCWQCGKQAKVNHSGICEVCWEKYAYLRGSKTVEEDDEYFERMAREAGGD